MTTNAKLATSPSKGNYFPVSVVERFIGRKGVEYTRAITAKGNRIVGPSRLFIETDTTAKVNAEELTVEAGVAQLKEHWRHR